MRGTKGYSDIVWSEVADRLDRAISYANCNEVNSRQFEPNSKLEPAEGQALPVHSILVRVVYRRNGSAEADA